MPETPNLSRNTTDEPGELVPFPGSQERKSPVHNLLEEDTVLDLLTRLIDKSLVSVAEHGGTEARYRMLETIRQYGWEELLSSGEADRVRQHHAQYYLALAEEAEPELSGAREGIWLARLEAEHGNLRAALHKQPTRAVKLWVAAETLREGIGLGLPLWDHTPTDYEAALAATRSQLGETTFEAARADGRAMSAKEAVEYALQGSEETVDASAHPANLSAREAEVLKLVAQG